MARRLHVVEPCDVPWDDMQPTAGGRHCARCDKRVVDFSKMSERDAALVVSLAERGSICGRLGPALLSLALATAACGGGATHAPSPSVAASSTSDAAPAPAPSIAAADVDSDHDRIPDSMDKCPNEPETYNGRDDEDGCPDKSIGVIVDNADVQVMAKIPFAKSAAKLAPESRATLDEIAAVLKSNPDLGTLTVRGHATPDEAKPGALVKDRPNAVIEALVKAGVDRKRLVAEPQLPKVEGDPAAGRAVDFRLVPPDPASCAPKP
ncbi:MAG: outer membrane protein OmpA [Myxococcaceae bacterium]|nr:outer membrane protein OmpA [Myxococcaceae bacterium]